MPSYWQYLAIYIKACVLLCTFMLTVELFVSWWVSINSICRPVVISWVEEMTMVNFPVCCGIKSSIVPMVELLAFGLRTTENLNVNMLHVLCFCRGESMVLLVVSFSLECSLGLICFFFLTYLYTNLECSHFRIYCQLNIQDFIWMTNYSRILLPGYSQILTYIPYCPVDSTWLEAGYFSEESNRR